MAVSILSTAVQGPQQIEEEQEKISKDEQERIKAAIGQAKTLDQVKQLEAQLRIGKIPVPE